MTSLPEIGGERMEGSIAEFEHRCKVYIGEEQSKIAPDNGLISLLCDAVRLAREFVGAVATPTIETKAQALEDAASEWDLWTANTLRDRAASIRKGWEGKL